MKPYYFIGDTHNDLSFVECAAYHARQHKAEIIQCGDWGFLWPNNDQLEELSDVLVTLGVTLRFIDGNHDDHPRLRAFCSDMHGTVIAPSIIYQPRGSVHEDEEGTRFLFLGGAPSIDRALRVEGLTWWPEEAITTEEFDRAWSAKNPIHVLVTHDAPAFPPGFGPKGAPGYQYDQNLSMDRIRRLIQRHRPQLHVHGHWHARSTTKCGRTRVEALASNQQDFEDAVLLWSRV